MVSGGLIVSGTPPLAGFRTSQVREPNQWFWRGIHLHLWMPSLGYHGEPSWDDSFSWSIFMTYLVYQGVYQTPDCSQMIGWYTIRQTQKQRGAAKLQEDLTALEGKKVADMFKPWKVHNRNYTEEPEVAIDTATFVASQPLYSRRISRIKKNFFPQGHMSEIYYQGAIQEFWNHLPEKMREWSPTTMYWGVQIRTSQCPLTQPLGPTTLVNVSGHSVNIFNCL